MSNVTDFPSHGRRKFTRSSKDDPIDDAHWFRGHPELDYRERAISAEDDFFDALPDWAESVVIKRGSDLVVPLIWPPGTDEYEPGSLEEDILRDSYEYYVMMWTPYNLVSKRKLNK